MTHVLESEVEAKLRKGVKKLGGMAPKWVSPGTRGVPDRLVFLPGGMVILVELKSDRGTLRPNQVTMRQKLKKLGVTVQVLKGMDEVDAFLQECERWIRL